MSDNVRPSDCMTHILARIYFLIISYFLISFIHFQLSSKLKKKKKLSHSSLSVLSTKNKKQKNIYWNLHFVFWNRIKLFFLLLTFWTNIHDRAISMTNIYFSQYEQDDLWLESKQLFCSSLKVNLFIHPNQLYFLFKKEKKTL